MVTTNEKGAKSEGAVLAALLRAGKLVLLPFGVARYDMAFDEGGKLNRVQVKTGRLRDGRIIFNAYSAPGGRKVLKYSSSEVEWIGIFCPDNNKTYLVPTDAVREKGWLRVEPTRNNQKSGVRWASDFEMPS